MRVRNSHIGEWVTQVARGRARELMGLEGAEEYSSSGFVFYCSTDPETYLSVENTRQHLHKHKFGVGGMDRGRGDLGGGAPPEPSPSEKVIMVPTGLLGGRRALRAAHPVAFLTVIAVSSTIGSGLVPGGSGLGAGSLSCL